MPNFTYHSIDVQVKSTFFRLLKKQWCNPWLWWEKPVNELAPSNFSLEQEGDQHAPRIIYIEASHKETVRWWSLITFNALEDGRKPCSLSCPSVPSNGYWVYILLLTNHLRKLLVNGFLDVKDFQNGKFHFTGWVSLYLWWMGSLNAFPAVAFWTSLSLWDYFSLWH